MGFSPMALVGRKHPVLNSPAREVKTLLRDGKWDRRVMVLAMRMRETLFRHSAGLALAAPQVGHSLRLVVTIDDHLWADPEIVDQSDKMISESEGCLSLPGRVYNVPRPRSVTVKFLDINGDEKFEDVELMAARLVCHEVDHLNGLLIAGRFEEIRQKDA